MNRAHRPLFASPVALLLGVLLQQATGCGSVSSDCSKGNCVDSTGGSSGTGGSGTGGADPACHLAPPGSAFTFHVHNGGTQSLRLPIGCGSTFPLTLSTSEGVLPIGPGGVTSCDFTCDAVYAGTAGPACSDCGAGMSLDLGPGVTADIGWDRRGYVATMSAPQCTDGAPEACALGEPVAPAAAQAGVVSVCSDGVVAPMGEVGACNTTPTAESFTIDTTKSEATIEVQ